MISKLLVAIVCLFACDNPPSADPAVSIDSILQKRYLAENIRPQPQCDDLQFLRRASLDLTGRIPTPSEVREFLQDPDRDALIDRLVDSAEFDQFLSEVWTAWLIGYSNAFQTDREVFRIWLERQLNEDASFKQIVEQLITARGSSAIVGPANFLVRHRDQPAVNISRSFLGVRLECAQCHDHPFDRWTQDDYQGMSLFFSSMRVRQRNQVAVLGDDIGSENGNNRPRFLTGSIPQTNRYRQELALYVVNCKPFARNFANRVWYHLMGRGIIDPPDDHNQENPPVDEDLYWFVSQFASHNDFDIKSMFRLICKSEAYGRGCANNASSTRDVQLFAARTIKPLLPEQFVDSLATATRRQLTSAERARMVLQVAGGARLTEDFQRTWDYRETVQQLMQKISTELPGNEQLGAWQLYAETARRDSRRGESAAVEPTDRQARSIEQLFLQILTRHPTDSELKRCLDQPLADITFALLFGNEFFFNH